MTATPSPSQLSRAGLVAVTLDEAVQAVDNGYQAREFDEKTGTFPVAQLYAVPEWATPVAPPVTPPVVPPVAPPVTPTPSANPSGFAPPASDAYPGLSLSFVDDFGGTAPNETIWGNPYSGNPSNEARMGKWLPSHLIIADSIANFKMYQDAAGNDSSDANWVGAGIQTRQAFTAGRIDVALRVDPCPHVSAIALMYHESSSVKDEIDFIETDPAADGSNTSFWASAHYGTGSAQVQKEKTATDLDDWHVWSTQWNAETISYFCDGDEWATFANPGVVNPMGFALQFQTGDYSLVMPPVGSTPVMQVDWVAAFVPAN